MNWAYLGLILFSFMGMSTLDWRFKLAFFDKPKSTTLTLLLLLVIFIIWDLIGIKLGIFFSGHSEFMSGIYLAKDFPLEEIFFLLFLSYFSLLVFRFLEEKWPRI